MASSLDNVGSSPPPIQKLVSLPPEEANKAPFPPGCKVVCFMKDGSPNVGIVKSVQLSISFKAGGTFNTFYQVEIQRSWRDAKSIETSLYQVEADDLRLTPGSPVYISSHYFGTDSDLLEGKEGLIEGVLLGCFDTPCMNCRKDTKKTSDDMTSKRRFAYSVEFKMKGVEEVAEEHGVPPEFVTYRSTKLTKKEGVIVVTLEDIGITIVPASGISQTASDGTSSTANMTTTSIHITNRDDTTTTTNKTTALVLNDLDSDVRKRPSTNLDSASSIDVDFYRSFSFDKNFNSNKSSNNNIDQLSNSDTSSRIDYSFSNNSVRTFFSQQRSPNSTDNDIQSKFDVSVDARLQSNTRSSNPERGILRSSSVDRRTSLGRSSRYSVTFADSDEVHEHSSGDSRSNSGVFTLGQPSVLLSSIASVRTFTPSKHAIDYLPHDNRSRTMQHIPAIENPGYELTMEKNQVSRMSSNEADHARNFSEMSDESKEHDNSDYDRFGSGGNKDNWRRTNESQRTFSDSDRVISMKVNSSQEPTYVSQDREGQQRERVYSQQHGLQPPQQGLQPQQQGQYIWGDIRRSQSYDVNTSIEVPYAEHWETRSSYDQTRRSPQGQIDFNPSYREQSKSQSLSYPNNLNRSSKEEPQQSNNNGRVLNRFQENTNADSKDNDSSPRRSNETITANSKKEEGRRNSTDGSFQRLNESVAGRFAREDTRRHSSDGSNQRSYEDNLKIKNIFEANRRPMPPEDGNTVRSTKSEVMEDSPPRKPKWNIPTTTYIDSKLSTGKEKDDILRPPTDNSNNRQVKNDDVQKRSTETKTYRNTQQYGMNGAYRIGSFDDHHSSQQGDSSNDKVVIENIQRSRSQTDSKDDESDKKSDVSPSSVIVRVETTKENEPKEEPIPERNEEEGCYLVYTEDSGGKLVLYYSRTVIEDAVGFWMPKGGKKFQGFKFSHNQGKVDLIKGIAGGDSNRRKYYHGWCQFFKAAAITDGLIYKRPSRGGIEVDLWVFYYETCTIEKVEDSQFFDATRIYAIACVPKNTMLFNGMKTSELGQFLQKGQLAGASITIDGNV